MTAGCAGFLGNQAFLSKVVRYVPDLDLAKRQVHQLGLHYAGPNSRQECLLVVGAFLPKISTLQAVYNFAR